jgi:hypothetical protein
MAQTQLMLARAAVGHIENVTHAWDHGSVLRVAAYFQVREGDGLLMSWTAAVRGCPRCGRWPQRQLGAVEHAEA